MSSLSGKVAWITGAGSGIGQAGAVALAAAGATVVVSGRRAEALEKTRKLIADAGGEVTVLPLDVANREAVRARGDDIIKRHGRIDILVNSAGTNVANRFYKEVTAEAWDFVVGVNLAGAMYCTLAALPSMRARKDGLVINIASWFGRWPSYLAGPAYGASKHGLAALTHQLNIEEGINGIRGCVIYPGEVATPILKSRPIQPSAEDEARMLRPEDLGRTIRFVAEMPAHVCLNEVVISPTWNRLLVGGRELRLGPQLPS